MSYGVIVMHRASTVCPTQPRLRPSISLGKILGWEPMLQHTSCILIIEEGEPVGEEEEPEEDV